MKELIDDKATRLWQKRILPFMITVIAALALFFVVATFWQLNKLNTEIAQSPKLNLTPVLESKISDEDNFQAQWKALVILEGNTLERRYHQATVLLMSRLWIRYLGFLTGMIISLIGATFILGKLRESTSHIEGEGGGGKLSVNTASPGIILALLGTCLMIIAMVTNPAIEVKDSRTYMGDKDHPLGAGVAQ